MTGRAGSAPDPSFGCSIPCRLLPWALGAAVLVVAVFAASRVDPGSSLPRAGLLRWLILATGAAAGIRIAVSFTELRSRVRVREHDILFEARRRTTVLRIDDVKSLDFDPPFRHYGRWPPALVLVDRRGRRHRVVALLAEGDRFVRELVSRPACGDVAAWAEGLGMERRMGRARAYVLAGYVLALSIVIAATIAWGGAAS